MNPAFSPASLRALELTINRYCDEFLKGIGDRANKNGGTVELNEWFYNLLFDVTTSVG